MHLHVTVNKFRNALMIFHYPFVNVVNLSLYNISFQLLNYFVWLRITNEGSVPEMRIWSILLIKSDLKWCIHLSKSLFLYFDRATNLVLNTSFP